MNILIGLFIIYQLLGLLFLAWAITDRALRKVNDLPFINRCLVYLVASVLWLPGIVYLMITVKEDD